MSHDILWVIYRAPILVAFMCHGLSSHMQYFLHINLVWGVHILCQWLLSYTNLDVTLSPTYSPVQHSAVWGVGEKKKQNCFCLTAMFPVSECPYSVAANFHWRRSLGTLSFNTYWRQQGLQESSRPSRSPNWYCWGRLSGSHSLQYVRWLVWDHPACIV